MRLMPESNAGKLDFCRSHLANWAAHAEEIGVSAEEVAALAELTEAARAAFNAKAQAEAVAQGATLLMNAAIEKMTTATAALVLKVRVKAADDGDGIYAIAHLPAPQKGSPIAAPGKPYRFKAVLETSGAVSLSWKCDHPRGAVGTVYQISRRIWGEAGNEYIHLDTVGKREFIDYFIPAGTAMVTYKVVGMRSTKIGLAGEHNVYFGGAEQDAALAFHPAA